MNQFYFIGNSFSPRSSLLLSFFRHIYYYPTPQNLSYFWSFGFLSGLFLFIQILSGIILALHYAPLAENAFNLVEHIMRDVNNGWLFRYIHSNGASFFFLVVYIHISRALNYRLYSFENTLLWVCGIIIFFLMMATAFMGYVLPWGQMSFWGATVITNLFSVIPFIGEDLVRWLWGGFAVGGPTLTRFFAFHFLFPFVLAVIALLHILFVHEVGSSNPTPVFTFADIRGYIPFSAYFFIKDFTIFFGVLLIFFYVIGYFPNVLGHSDNYIVANPLSTPTHIVPEWYFLPFYAILRSVELKELGVILMFASIVLFIIFPIISAVKIWNFPFFTAQTILNLTNNSLFIKIRDEFIQFSNSSKTYYFSFISFYTGLVFCFFGVFILLGWLGSQEATLIYVNGAFFFMVVYFVIVFLLPVLSWFLSMFSTSSEAVSSENS